MRLNRNAAWILPALLIVSSASAEDAPATSPTRRKVLVELFTSQGCNSCPAAERVFGKLESLGVERSRIVPIAFHVDYFNKPWKDPYSDEKFSRREYEYSIIYQKEKKIEKSDYLYFTPMMMIDGRYPMLGSNAPEAKRSLAKALAEKPEVAIKATWEGKESAAERTLQVKVTSRSSLLNGRPLLVGVAVTENPISTKVESGENGGKTLVEHFAVRSFDIKPLKLDVRESKSLNFLLTTPKNVDVSKLSVAVFVQGVSDGRVHQAESVEWVAAKPAR